MINLKNNNHGFTLLELLIYVAILGVVTVVVSQTYILFSKSRAQVESRAQVNSDLRFAMELIGKDIEQAAAVADPATPGATSSEISLTIAGQSVVYSILNGFLQKQVGAGAPEKIISSSTLAISLVATRLENTNQILGKKKVSVQYVLTGQNFSSSPDWQSSQVKQATVTLTKDQ